MKSGTGTRFSKFAARRRSKSNKPFFQSFQAKLMLKYFFKQGYEYNDLVRNTKRVYTMFFRVCNLQIVRPRFFFLKTYYSGLLFTRQSEILSVFPPKFPFEIAETARPLCRTTKGFPNLSGLYIELFTFPWRGIST